MTTLAYFETTMTSTLLALLLIVILLAVPVGILGAILYGDSTK
jgi:hypothetical protein